MRLKLEGQSSYQLAPGPSARSCVHLRVHPGDIEGRNRQAATWAVLLWVRQAPALVCQAGAGTAALAAAKAGQDTQEQSAGAREAWAVREDTRAHTHEMRT